VQELADRFQIHGAAADGVTLRRLAATLPIGVNPWSTRPIAIASVDYVKRPEVFPAVASCRWDLVVVDEAHACGGDSDRRAAVHALAARAAYLLMLSATPHNGRSRRVRIVVRNRCSWRRRRAARLPRTREEAGSGVPRHIHIVRVGRRPAKCGCIVRWRDIATPCVRTRATAMHRWHWRSFTSAPCRAHGRSRSRRSGVSRRCKPAIASGASN